MLHEYRKKTTIKAEQFDGSDEMKAKLLLVPVIAMMGLMVSAPLPASADTTDPTRVEIEAEGNQQIQAYWNEYQQALVIPWETHKMEDK